MNRFFPGKLFQRRVVVPCVLFAIALSILPAFVINAFAAGAHTSSTSHVVIRPMFRQHFNFLQAALTPPTDAQCRARFGTPCYSPQEIRTAYDVTPLLNAGYTGKGQSIVIIDSFGSPTIRQDLQTFDAGYGLPDPPSFKILTPLGTIKFDPNNSDMVGWAFETSLDVEWAHAMAPGANIVLMTSPVDETEGVQGLPEFLYLEKYAVTHNLGKIVSQSWGATENTLFTPGGRQVLNQFNDFYKQATTEKGVTFFASAGDFGTGNPDINGNIYPFPTVGFPASSPYVTAVGGTSLYATTTGSYQSETVWDEVAKSGGATGGGISQYFHEPSYQHKNLPSSVQKELKGFRGLPDISWNADPYTAILVYISFLTGKAGYYFIGGTSEGSPQWAGITADADQWAHHSLGFLNPALYSIGNSDEYASSFHDITVGNNGYNGIPGYGAAPGWDLATGWGSPKTATLMRELIKRIH
jgi:subtilase family serine protease